jgi:hypothetical protein
MSLEYMSLKYMSLEYMSKKFRSLEYMGEMFRSLEFGLQLPLTILVKSINPKLFTLKSSTFQLMDS